MASEAKAIWSPSPEIDGLKLSPLPCTELPPFFTDTSSVVLAVRSRRKTSVLPLVSFVTRSVASDEKATCVPIVLRLGTSLASFPGDPPVATLTSWVDGFVPRVRTKTSGLPLVSPGTRLVADEVKAMTVPVSSIEGDRLSPLAWLPSSATLTRVIVLCWRS